MKKSRKIGVGIAIVTSAIGMALAAHRKLKNIEKAELMDTSQWNEDEIEYEDIDKKDK